MAFKFLDFLNNDNNSNNNTNIDVYKAPLTKTKALYNNKNNTKKQEKTKQRINDYKNWAKNVTLIFLSSLGSIQPQTTVAIQRLFQTQYQPLPLQIRIHTPGWREAIIVKHLAQGHKCRDQNALR